MEKQYAIKITDKSRAKTPHYVAGLPGEYHAGRQYKLHVLEEKYPGRVDLATVKRLQKNGAPIELIELEEKAAEKPAKVAAPAEPSNSETPKDAS